MKTKSLLFILLAAALLFCGCSGKKDKQSSSAAPSATSIVSSVFESSKADTAASSATSSTDTSSVASTPQSTVISDDGKEDASSRLFIGDSRTVGLESYSGLSADYFADVGMSIYNIYDKTLNVGGSPYTVKQLLSSNKYDKIYLMLGVNEIGYALDSTVKKYSEFVDYIREAQPSAKVYIQANLHVAAARSASDTYVNNKNLNRFNKAISELADGKTVFYLDINTVFDDADGNLQAERTPDNTHLYAKDYAEWAKWIIKQSE